MTDSVVPSGAETTSVPVVLRGPGWSADDVVAYDGDDGRWANLTRLRVAFLDAGYTEHRGVGDFAARASLVTRSGADGTISEALLPLLPTASDVFVRAEFAVRELEAATGRVRVDLGAFTAREVELSRVLAQVQALVGATSWCEGHREDPDGTVHHPSRMDPARPDLFLHGRCEMRSRVHDRLTHLVAGGD